MRKKVFKKFFHIKNDALNRMLAIFVSYGIVLSATALGLTVLIPELIDSLNQLLEKMPSWANSYYGLFKQTIGKVPGFGS